MRLSQHQLCTREMELALEVILYFNFHWVTRPWRRTLTNGSDVKTYFRGVVWWGTAATRDVTFQGETFTHGGLSSKECRNYNDVKLANTKMSGNLGRNQQRKGTWDRLEGQDKRKIQGKAAPLQLWLFVQPGTQQLFAWLMDWLIESCPSNRSQALLR